METLMSIQSTPLGKGFITHITYVRTLSSMYTVVYCQVTLTTETFTTQNAGIWIVIIVPEHMSFQRIQGTKRHITHITVIWSLLSMRDFMPLQIILRNK